MLWSAMALIPVLLMYLLLLLIALYCWFRWSHREILRAAADLPVTHKAWPILGHSFTAFGGLEAVSKFVLEVSKVAVEKGMKTICFWCGPLPLIVVHDMQDIQTVLNSSNAIDKADEYEYFKFGFDSELGPMSYSLLTAPVKLIDNSSFVHPDRYKLARIPLGLKKVMNQCFCIHSSVYLLYGGITAENLCAGKRWRVTRKHMDPLFHPKNLQYMTQVFNQNCREYVSRLSEHVEHGPVNLMPYTMDTALKTICNLVFGPGVDIDLNSPDFQGLMSVVESIPEMFIRRLLQPWLRVEMIFRFFHRNELKKLNQFWNNFNESRLEMVKEIRKQKNLQPSSLDDDDTTVTEPLNILDAFSTLQKSHPEFTEVDMRCEMLTFYNGGTESMASATCSCLLALAQFTDFQERLYQEVCSVVGPDDDVTLQDLNRMPYLDQVVKETLRWFLVIPYLMRKAANDLKLSTCTIPAGHPVVLSLFGVHMDPKIYPDPVTFNPDRFSHENGAGKERSSYIPFSGGPRNCVAKAYALQTMKIMVVHVLRKFKLKTDMDIYTMRKKLVVILISADGYNVHLEERC